MRLLRLATFLALAGCTSAAISESESLDDRSLGVLSVERGVGVDGTMTAIDATFSRYRGLDGPAVLGVLGLGATEIELDSCSYRSERDSLVVERGEVELLDVGALRVRVAGAEAVFVPRAFPDLASMMAGVLYAGDAMLPEPRADLDAYQLSAEGSDEVASFSALVLAPPAPLGIEVDGTPAAAALVLSRDRGLALSWLPGGSADVLEVEIRSRGDSLACVARDDGLFQIDAETLGTLAPDRGAQLIVRRVRTTSVEVPGLDESFARVSVRAAAPAEIR